MVSLFFLSIPLAARAVDASTPVPARLEVSEAIVSELDSYVNSFFESVKNGTIKEYIEKADYIFEFVIKNMDAVDDPALLVEIVGSVANTLEKYSPNAGVDYMTALRDALPPLAIEGRKFDYVMTAAKCEVYEILIRREIDKFEGTPNVKSRRMNSRNSPKRTNTRRLLRVDLQSSLNIETPTRRRSYTTRR